MITLLQFPSSWPELPNPSPFCTKVEVFLRMAGLDYTEAAWSPTRAPTGKAPVIELDGALVGDSSAILRTLVERYDLHLDDHLDPAARARGHLVKRTLEEHSYWGLLYLRWVDDAGWSIYRPIIGESFPAPVRPLLLPWLRRNVRNSCRAHGLSRHAKDEVIRRLVADIDAVAAVLGDSPYLLGDQPTTFDATAWSFLAHLAVDLVPGPVSDRVRHHPNLAAYVARGKEQWGWKGARPAILGSTTQEP